MEDDGIIRQSANYTPSVWGDYFIKHSAPFSSAIKKTEEWIRERVEQLVRQVKSLLQSTDYSKNEFDILQLIDALQRLGISYHFEEEIDQKLRDVYDHNNGEFHEINLEAAALKFRLLRQHGYRVTSDLFSKYKDEEGKFKSDLADDVRGLLSLYEACFMATHEDDILNEALSFTKHHFQRLLLEKEDLQLNSAALKKLISQALELPLHEESQDWEPDIILMLMNMIRSSETIPFWSLQSWIFIFFSCFITKKPGASPYGGTTLDTSKNSISQEIE